MKSKEQKRQEAYTRRTASWINLTKVGIIPSIADLKRAVNENPYNANTSHQLYLDAEVKYMHALLNFKPSTKQLADRTVPEFYRHMEYVRAASHNYGPDSFIGLVVGFQELRYLSGYIEFIQHLETKMPTRLDGVSRWNVEWDKGDFGDSKRAVEYKQNVVMKAVENSRQFDH